MKHTLRILLAALWISGCGKDIPEAPAPVSAPPPLPSTGAPSAAAPVAPATALAGFEGEIGLKLQGDDKPAKNLTVSVKGTKFRFGVPEGLEHSRQFGSNIHVIVDASAKKLMAVIDDKRQVISLDLDRIGDQIKGIVPPSLDSADKPRTPPKVAKTGRTDTVAGYSCEEWEITSEDGDRVKLCVATQGAAWFSLPTLGLPAEHAWARDLLDGQHLPLRAITLDEAGKETGRLEVTKLDKKPVADAVFEAPTGYKVTDVAAMMAGFMNAAKAMGQPSDKPGATAPKPGEMPPNIREMMEKMRLRAEQRKAAKKPKD